MVARRAAREPVALIIGHREFWGRDFEVTADVLIPRPESEFVIETVLECVGASPAGDDGASARPLTVSKIIDIGTGSGCLAVTLAALFPSTSVVATDTSAAALDVARRNAARHGVAERIQFVQADLLAGLELTADLIVSNPPYVPSAAERTLQPEVALFEPSLALFGGADGLDIVRRLLETAPARLAPGGRLVLEFGDGQEEEIRGLAGARGWHILGIRNDLQDIARVALLGR
jgi:release factor glutamine methyltransferase